MRSIGSIKSLPQPHMDEKATLGDEQDATARGTPTTHATPPTPAHHTPVHTPPLPARTTRRPHGASAGGLAWGRVWTDAVPVIGTLRGCSLMVEHELPKLRARVRFSSPAPPPRPRSSTRALLVVRTTSGFAHQIRTRQRALSTDRPANQRSRPSDTRPPPGRPLRVRASLPSPRAAELRRENPGARRQPLHLADACPPAPARYKRSWYDEPGMRSCSHLHSVNTALFGGTSHCGCNRARLGRHHA